MGSSPAVADVAGVDAAEDVDVVAGAELPEAGFLPFFMLVSRVVLIWLRTPGLFPYRLKAQSV